MLREKLRRLRLRRAVPSPLRREYRRVFPKKHLPVAPYEVYEKRIANVTWDTCHDELPDPPTLPPPYEMETFLKDLDLPRSRQMQALEIVDHVMARVNAKLPSLVGDTGDVLAVSSAIRHGCTMAATRIAHESHPCNVDREIETIHQARSGAIKSVTAAANAVILAKQVTVAIATAEAITEVSYKMYGSIERHHAAKGHKSAEYINALGLASGIASCMTSSAHGTAGNIAMRRYLIVADWSDYASRSSAAQRAFLPTLARHGFDQYA